MTPFLPDQSANTAHIAMKSALKSMESAKQCAVLWFGEILERKLYLALGYSSINQYAKVELGFSSSRTGDFIQLCRKLKNLPLIKEKVASGELGYTPARVLVSVADKSNEKEWLKVGLNSSRRKLEKEVKRAKIAARNELAAQPSLMPVLHDRPVAIQPVRVSVEMSPTQFARYEALWEKIHKRGQSTGNKVETILEMMASFVDGTNPKSSPRGEHLPATKPPVQIHIHQCPDCAQASIPSSKGELKIGKPELERAQCDCQVSQPDQRNTTSIPPATRRLVLARDRHQCQRPGCDHTLFLEIHHIIPRSQGGSNNPENLSSLCSGCHQLLHDNPGSRSVLMAKEEQVIYGWNPRRNRHTSSRFPSDLLCHTMTS
jgi:hypothetical protein